MDKQQLQNAQKRISELTEQLEKYNKAYYDLDNPTISDF
jgi:NAD-dependent DNA ligase